MVHEIVEGVDVGDRDHLADAGVGVAAADHAAPGAEAAAAEADVVLLGQPFGHVLLLGGTGVDQGDQGVGAGGLDGNPAEHAAEAAKVVAEAAERRARQSAAAGIGIGVHDVGDDDVVGGLDLAAAHVGAALQLAVVGHGALLVAHGQGLTAGDHAEAVGATGQKLDQGLGIGEPEGAPPIALGVLDGDGADRARAVLDVGGGLVRGRGGAGDHKSGRRRGDKDYGTKGHLAPQKSCPDVVLARRASDAMSRCDGGAARGGRLQPQIGL